MGFPRLYAAASLKHGIDDAHDPTPFTFSAALCRGLIEATSAGGARRRDGAFSAALCRGLIEAWGVHSSAGEVARAFSAALCRGLIEAERGLSLTLPLMWRFPRLYAAASLKLLPDDAGAAARGWFSAALCRGLIEANSCRISSHSDCVVFRGFMPRPH